MDDSVDVIEGRGEGGVLDRSDVRNLMVRCTQSHGGGRGGGNNKFWGDGEARSGQRHERASAPCSQSVRWTLPYCYWGSVTKQNMSKTLESCQTKSNQDTRECKPHASERKPLERIPSSPEQIFTQFEQPMSKSKQIRVKLNKPMHK